MDSSESTTWFWLDSTGNTDPIAQVESASDFLQTLASRLLFFREVSLWGIGNPGGGRYQQVRLTGHLQVKQ